MSCGRVFAAATHLRSGLRGGFAVRRATATRPGLAPAGEVLLVDAKRTQKRLLNVHAHGGVQSHPTRCVRRRRTEQKYCSIRARAPGLGPRGTLEGRKPARGAQRHAVWNGCASCGISRRDGAGAAVLRLGHPECSVHSRHGGRARMGQPYVSVPPAGEHTVSNAVARPGAHGRLEDVFGSFWRPPKGSRLPGRDPAAWQCTAFERSRDASPPPGRDPAAWQEVNPKRSGQRAITKP